MFQRSGAVCSRCVRWTEKVSIQFLVMGSQKEGQGHGKGSVTLSDTGHKWFVYSVTRAIRETIRDRPSAVYGSFNTDRSSFKTSLHLESCFGRGVIMNADVTSIWD